MEKKRPVKTIKRGIVEAAIWENTSEKGSFYNVTFSRTYKDGDNLKTSSSFGSSDLLRIARLAELADAYVHEPK